MEAKSAGQKQDGVDMARTKRRAVELLLAWGFKPSVIADQLGCSRSWIWRIRRTSDADSGMRDGPKLNGI